jgi:hypothetical protein
VGICGTTPAAAGSFNNKSADITTAANRVSMGAVRYNTSSYNQVTYNPWRTGEVFQVPSTYNDRNKNPRQQVPVYRMETSYSRFACEIRTARAFDNKNTARTTCQEG